MLKITRNELIDILKEVKGFTPIFIIYGGNYTKSRKKNGKALLNQKCFMNCSINLNYKEAVKRRLVKDGNSEIAKNFKPLPPNGMEYVEGTRTLVKGINTGKISLRISRFRKNSKKTYLIDNETGKFITFSEAIKNNMLQPAFFKEKSTVGQNKVSKENDFSFVYIGLNRIKYISINKQKYMIVD